jgi:hypothetical protein
MCSALSLSAVAHASDWQFVAESISNAVYYIDAETIRTSVTSFPSSSVKIAWFKIDYSRDKSVTYRLSKVLYHVKCDTSELKMVQWIEYKSDMTVSDSGSNTYGSFSVAAPDTIGSSLVSAACDAKYGTNVPD